MGGSLYDQFHTNVKGIGSLSDATDALNRQSVVYENVRDNLTQALSRIKTTYNGKAADAMSDAFKPLADSFNDGANFAGSAALATDFQANSFSATQAKIVNQVPVPAAPFYEPIDPFSTAHDDAIKQNTQIDAVNEAAYNAYGSDTNGNLGYVQPTATNSAGFGSFSVTQEGNGTTVGSGSSAPRSVRSPSRSGGPPLSASNYSRGSGAPGESYSPPSPASGSASSGPSGGSGPALSPVGQTSTSGFPTTYPGGTTGADPSGQGPGLPGGWGSGGTPNGSAGGSSADGGSPVVGGFGQAPTGGQPTGGGGAPMSGDRAVSGRSGGFGPNAGGGEPGAGGAEPGAGGADGSRSGAGGMAGAAGEAAMERTASGRPGEAGIGGMAGGRGGRGGEDNEHKTASYLTNEDNGNLIIGDIDPVAPPVIGG